jgi:hypothetical protein
MSEPESEYWLLVFGGGSFCIPPGKTWREGKYKITLEQAEAVLAWLDDHPGVEWLLLTTDEPEFDGAPLTGMLTLADVQFGTHRRRPTEDEEPPPLREPDRPDLVNECDFDGCFQKFPSPTALRRHVRLAHTLYYDNLEEQAREQVELDKEAKAEAERVRLAPRDELHPAERSLEDEPDAPTPRPSLWPKGLGG